MKVHLRPGAFLSALLLVGAVLQAQVAPVPRILPLGDSITQGHTPWASYRSKLWRLLDEADLAFDFVGTQSGPLVTHDPFDPTPPGMDDDHEGHSGLPTAVFANFASLLPSADFVLLHLGTNNFQPPLGGTWSIPGALGDLQVIITGLRSVNPTVVILLAQIIPTLLPGWLATIASFNYELESFANDMTQPGSPVILVDLFNGFRPSTETYDGVHPNHVGQQDMAERWFGALAPFLTGSIPPPSYSLLANQYQGIDTLSVLLVGAPVNSRFLTIFTLDTGNADGGLGLGFFFGLHVTQFEISAFPRYFLPASGSTHPSGLTHRFQPFGMQLLAGLAIYGVSFSYDAATLKVRGVSAPLTYHVF